MLDSVLMLLAAVVAMLLLARLKSKARER